jgi:tRNA dimethylallyltransferase
MSPASSCAGVPADGPPGLPVLMLMGPTAAGKSALAMAIAEQHNGEIICVDSATVYRNMDAGTAKPSQADRARIAHHLLDLIEPTEAYSAARFRSDALAAIAGIHARGRRAILAGGTMLYFKALLHGLDILPGADPSLRAEIDARAVREGWPALHAELARHDPLTATRLEPTDAQRIQRALEVWQLTGQPLSSLHGRAGNAAADQALPRFVRLALAPSDRATLHARIANRFDAMLAAGLLAELCQLRRRYPALHRGLPAMRCVGYRQAWERLEDEIDDRQLRIRGIVATRQLAKRQLTWLRGLGADLTLDCLRTDLLDSGVAAASHLLAA